MQLFVCPRKQTALEGTNTLSTLMFELSVLLMLQPVPTRKSPQGHTPSRLASAKVRASSSAQVPSHREIT